MMRAPHPKAAGTAAGVTETMIAALVHAFYAKVRRDAVLGPIFEAAVKDWDAHLATMCTFWSSVMLMTGRYKGHPMAAHARLPSLGRPHFERWLALFAATAAEVCPNEAAALFVDRARRIAQSLQAGLALSRAAAAGAWPPGRAEDAETG